MKEKHRGYSIIECTASFAVIIILVSITVKFVRNYNDIISDVKLKSVAYEIDDVINYSKWYCYNNNQFGKIEIFNLHDDMKIVFMSDDGNKRIINLPSGITFYNMTEDYKVILISPKGIVKGITIELQSNSNNFIAAITVNVSANRIKIRKEG